MPKTKKLKPYQLNPEPFKKWSPVDSTAIYEHIKEMVSWCQRARSIMPKSERYDLGSELYRSAKAVMVAMRKEYRAPSFPETKIRLLSTILDLVDNVIVDLQVCQDLNAISGQFFDIIASECRAIVEHTTRMINSERRRQLEADAALEKELQTGTCGTTNPLNRANHSQNSPVEAGPPAAGGVCMSSGRTTPRVIGPRLEDSFNVYM